MSKMRTYAMVVMVIVIMTTTAMMMMIKMVVIFSFLFSVVAAWVFLDARDDRSSRQFVFLGLYHYTGTRRVFGF